MDTNASTTATASTSGEATAPTFLELKAAYRALCEERERLGGFEGAGEAELAALWRAGDAALLAHCREALGEWAYARLLGWMGGEDLAWFWQQTDLGERALDLD